jgi:hypothetical protein
LLLAVPHSQVEQEISAGKDHVLHVVISFVVTEPPVSPTASLEYSLRFSSGALLRSGERQHRRSRQHDGERLKHVVCQETGEFACGWDDCATVPFFQSGAERDGFQSP